MMKRRRVVVLISGRGSNMEALMAACGDPDYPAEIVGVVANRTDAKGLETAARAGIATAAVPNRDFADRAAHEAAVSAAVAGFEPDLICLAGYMRILSADFVRQWEGRMINIHPSLLPAFPGLHTHRRAIETGCRIHGCTVHFVTEVMDEGPIIAQAAVPVLAGDTEDDLSARVLAAEHQLYPLALALVASGAARVENGRVVHERSKPHTGTARLLSPAQWREAVDLEELARMTP